jgi:hypothetical protein
MGNIVTNNERAPLSYPELMEQREHAAYLAKLELNIEINKAVAQFKQKYSTLDTKEEYTYIYQKSVTGYMQAGFCTKVGEFLQKEMKWPEKYIRCSFDDYGAKDTYVRLHFPKP